MKHARNCLTFASAGIVLAGSQPLAQSATVIRTVTTEVVGSDVNVLFDPVDEASELVSITDASVFTQEGGSITVNAIVDNSPNPDSLVQLFSGVIPLGTYNFQNTPLEDFTSNTFTFFPVPSTVKGLNFQMGAGVVGTPVITLPVGSTFTFTVPDAAIIPETTTVLVSMLGVGMLTLRRRRD